MNAGQTNIKVGSLATPIRVKGKDAILNGLICEVANPYDDGCTDKEWIGLKSNDFTVYGHHFNCKESEVFVFNKEQAKIIKDLMGLHNTKKIYYTGTEKTRLSSFEIKKCYSKNPYSSNILDYIEIKFIKK